MKSRANADVFAGLFFCAIGLIGLLVNDFGKIGTTFRMGPAYMPVALSLGVLGLGVVVAIRGFMRGGEPIPLGTLRPPLLIALAVGAFALSARSFGLAPAVFLTMVIAGLAFGAPRRLELVVAAAVMAIFCSAVFVWGLGLTMSVIAL